MNISTLYDTLSTGISGYTPLEAWALSRYGKSHTIIGRADKRDGPDETDCPCCVLTPIAKEMSQEDRRVYHDFSLDVIIYDGTSLGFKYVEEFRVLLQDAMKAAVAGGNINLVDIRVDYDLSSSFPFIGCGMLIRFLESITLGTDPLS